MRILGRSTRSKWPLGLTDLRLKEELTEDRQRYKKLQDSSVKDKDTIVNLELKVNELETENLEKEMKSKDMEIKANSLERQLKRFEVGL